MATIQHQWKVAPIASVTCPALSITAANPGGRPIGLQLGISGTPSGAQSVDYTYQNDGRLSTITANASGFSTPAFTYTYATNSHLIASTVNTTLGYTDVRTYDAKNDWLDDRETKWSTTTKAKFAYTQDNIGRVTEVAKTGEMFNRYGTGNAGLTTYYTYTDRSELKSEITKLGTVSPTVVLTGRNDSLYEYDPIGNRKKVTHNARDFEFTTNSRNGYGTRAVPGFFDVAGFDTAAQVTVSNDGAPPTNTATRHGEYFFNDYPLDNDPDPAWASLKIIGSSTTFLPAFLAKVSEPFTYDDDGNLLTDSRWSYTYDAENRLIAMETATSVIPNVDKRRLEFTYDYLGRRVRKIVRNGYDGSSYTTEVSDTKFVYNGWNCIAALDANNSEALVASYFWGMDIAGPGQRAGGIGGLLMIQQDTLSYVPAYDAGGNVHALIRTSDGSIQATYEYDAFGNTLRELGTYAASNSFRYSTKFTDTETGLVYFGLRYYSPALGRFITRDPISERGGRNLYSFASNNPINKWDYLGMWPNYPDLQQYFTMTWKWGYKMTVLPTVTIGVELIPQSVATHVKISSFNDPGILKEVQPITVKTSVTVGKFQLNLITFNVNLTRELAGGNTPSFSQFGASITEVDSFTTGTVNPWKLSIGGVEIVFGKTTVSFVDGSISVKPAAATLKDSNSNFGEAAVSTEPNGSGDDQGQAPQDQVGGEREPADEGGGAEDGGNEDGSDDDDEDEDDNWWGPATMGGVNDLELQGLVNSKPK